MLLVDGKYFVMGGTGIHEKMSREEVPVDNRGGGGLGAAFIDNAFRDTDIIGHGSVARTMRNQFFNLYRIWEYRMTNVDNPNRYFSIEEGASGYCQLFHQPENLIENSEITYVVAGPEHRQNNPISSAIGELVETAQEEVRVANLLFNPDEIVSKALSEARKRKIKVQAYLNGTGKNSSSSHYLYALPNRFNYDLLTTVHEYQKPGQLYHKKLLTVDHRYTVVGSFNLGVKSAKCDYENVCIIRDPRVTGLMEQALEVDATHSKTLTTDTIKKEHGGLQLLNRVAINLLGPYFG